MNNSILSKRHEFVLYFDVENGNPNGDPDAGNQPRLDPETNHGLVTDVCLKRKLRNYVALKHDFKPPHAIYVTEKAVLNDNHQMAYDALGLKAESKKLPKEVEKARALTDWMCKQFFDIRAFGAVMATEVNCGQVRGPVQFAFARSVDPVVPLDISMTRCAVTNAKDLEKERTMGRKSILPYGLYRAHGFVSAALAAKTGFTEADMELLLEALANMFEHDRSAARGLMSVRKLLVFRHQSVLGDASAHALFDLVTQQRANEQDSPSRSFSDYSIQVNRQGLPTGVELLEVV
jgi:CRISPR-associated protein Csd2